MRKLSTSNWIAIGGMVATLLTVFWPHPPTPTIKDSPCSNNTVGQTGGTNTVVCDPLASPFFQVTSIPSNTNVLTKDEYYRTSFRVDVGNPPTNKFDSLNISLTKRPISPVSVVSIGPITFDHSFGPGNISGQPVRSGAVYRGYIITKNKTDLSKDFEFRLN